VPEISPSLGHDLNDPPSLEVEGPK
jgi:hypothetical protein